MMDFVKLVSVKGVKDAVSAVLACALHARLSMLLNTVANMMQIGWVPHGLSCHVKRRCAWTFMTKTCRVCTLY